MQLKRGSLEIDTRHGLYFKIPLIGACHFGPYGLVFDSWSEIKRIERAWQAR